MRELVNNLVDKYNSRFDSDMELQEKLGSISRTIQIELDDGVFYCLRMEGGRIIKVMEEAIEEPDLRIITDRSTFEGIVEGTVKPLKAYALHKIKFKGALKDRLLLKDILSKKKKKTEV